MQHQPQTRPEFGAHEVQALWSLAIALVVMAVALFWPAGTLRWTRGWVFFGVYLSLIVIAMIWLWRVNPEIFAATLVSAPSSVALTIA